LIRDKDSDVVFVLSRHDSHAQCVIAALSNRTPVFVEKPFGHQPRATGRIFG